MNGHEPRPAHYTFAHRMLPTMYFHDPRRLLMIMERDGVSFLRYMWIKLHADMGLADDVQPAEAVSFAPDGENSHKTTYLLQSELSLSRHALDDGMQVWVVGLPQPLGITEAYYVGLSYNPRAEADKAARYFTFEHGANFEPTHVRVVLGEWTPDHSHFNYGDRGDGATPTAEGFVAAIQAILTPRPTE